MKTYGLMRSRHGHMTKAPYHCLDDVMHDTLEAAKEEAMRDHHGRNSDELVCIFAVDVETGCVETVFSKKLLQHFVETADPEEYGIPANEPFGDDRKWDERPFPQAAE